MESYRQRVREFHQHFRALDINMITFKQYAEYYAIHIEPLGILDIGAHNVKFMGGVTKIAGPRSNHDMNGNTYVAASFLHQSSAGSYPAGR